jgi:hypothetical protein
MIAVADCSTSARYPDRVARLSLLPLVLLLAVSAANAEGMARLDDAASGSAGGPVPRAITSRGLENLVAFTRLFGIVRHFHPTDEAAAADWNAMAVHGAEAVEGAKDAAGLVAALEQLFLPLAPTLRVFPSTATPPPPPATPANAQAIVSWTHRGLAGKDPRSIYRSERTRRPLDKYDPRSPIRCSRCT